MHAGNIMIVFASAFLIISAVNALPLKESGSDIFDISEGIVDNFDAFGNQLRYDHTDSELTLLQDGREDKGDSYYRSALRVNLAPPAHDEDDTYPVLLLDEGKEVPAKGRYIAELKNTLTEGCRAALERFLEANCDGIIVGRDLPIVDGFSFAATRAALDACLLNSDREVAACGARPRSVRSLLLLAEEDRPVHTSAASAAEAPIWSLDRIDQRDGRDGGAYAAGDGGGAGVNVYVVDTGIRVSHKEFGGRAKQGYSVIKDGKGSTDCDGHGTHCAGTVGSETYGVAKAATLIAVRVLDCDGSGTSSGVIRGYNYVLEQHRKGAGPSVVSASLGGEKSRADLDAVRRLAAAGVTVVVAAGNENADACGFSPADAGGSDGPAITVASSDIRDRRSGFSCFGPCTDLFAPGSDIKSLGYKSDTATDTMSGTSMATPAVAGAAALILARKPDATPAQVKAEILCKATPGKIGNTRGTPNLLLFVGADAKCDGDATPAPVAPPTPAPAATPAPAGACPRGCPRDWLGDGECDDECNSEACGYDGGDCEAPGPSGGGRMVTTGCPGKRGAPAPRCAAEATRAGSVRCCQRNGGKGRTPRPCLSARTFAEATAACAGLGMEICSSEELHSTCGTGCGFDKQNVWVADSC